MIAASTVPSTAPAAALRPVRVGPADAVPPDVTLADLRQRMATLVRRALGDVPLRFGAPTAGPATERAVGLYLMALDAAPPQARSARVLQIGARCLVTTWGADAAAAADDLVQLALATLETPELEPDFTPLPAQAWSAFGVAPRASFMLNAPVRRIRAAVPGGPPVRVRRLEVTVLRGRLEGVLVAHDDTPLAGARIDLPAFARSTTTDALGRFRFASVPGGEPLAVQARTHGVLAEFEFTPPASGEPLPPLRIDLSQPQP